jgi:hypothetical protein
MIELLIEFENFPEERSIIGQLLMAYGEIEFALVRLFNAYFEEDDSVAARVLFRVRGEGPRLELADALLRPAMGKAGLKPQWGIALGAARHCKNIRNQYAHCHWWYDEGVGLCFMNLDEEVSSKEGALEVTFKPINLGLLKEQHLYFSYALDCLYYLDGEYRKKKGLSPTLDLEVPKSIPAPPLHSHQT